MSIVSKLFWLVVLGLVVIYIYSVGAFAFFAEEFHDPDRSNGQLYCNSLLQCWITIIHYILIGQVSYSLNYYYCPSVLLVYTFDISRDHQVYQQTSKTLPSE